jgi:hypothetical protein
MANTDDLANLSPVQLVQAYLENARSYEQTDHVGVKNRLFDRRMKIAAEMKARDRTLLGTLMDYPEPQVRSWAQWDVEDRPTQERPPCSPLGLEWQWQCENPPPPAMTGAEIARLLRDALPDFADRPIELALPAIGLWPQRLRMDRAGGASRLGGMPLAPSGWQWPTVEAEPLLFVGQIDCAELRGLPGAEQLPSAGLLALFGDYDAVMACRYEARDIAVHHWPDIDRLMPATPPIEPACIFPPCALAFRPLIDLPDPFSRVVQNLLQGEQVSRYAATRNAVRRHGIPDDLDSYCSFGKLLGWPALVQQHDLDEFDSDRGPDMRLLLQVDDYSNGDALHGWGGGGSLYFVMHDEDLRMQRYECCEFDIQFT